ncbi:peptide ABC transporter substrate-binding protein, partial [Aliarcobacter butzleri]
PRIFESLILGWSLPLTPDAYPLWLSSSDILGGFNLPGYKIEKVDELIENALNTINYNELSNIYKEIFKQISNDVTY